MLQSTLMNPATGSLAAIVGTPPTAQRYAGDGSPAPDSFASALDQASGPPAPPASSPASSAREEARAGAAAAQAPTAEDRPAPTADNLAAMRAAAQRKAAAAKAGLPDDKTAPAALAAATAPTENGPAALATTDPETPPADRARDAGDTTPEAGTLLATLVAGTPSAIDRVVGKAALPPAGLDAVKAAPAAARNGAAAATDAASPDPSGATRRVDSGAEAQAEARTRDTATPAALSAVAPAPAASPAWTAASAAHQLATPAPTAAAASASTPTVFEARLQASPGGTEFAPALGAQLNTFLREGVQHARLHLNPAELGPLTVQIQLDGAAAQVRLAAEHPLTRQALEQAMPTLAGTLRESGLTLTGGGVFEQPADPQPQQDARPSPGERSAGTREGRDPAGQAEAAAPRAVLARRGVVDLVA